MGPCRAGASVVASKIAKDAVLSHHTAWESHGCAHNVWFHIIYTARHPCPPVRLRGALVRGTRTPASLLAQGAMQYETQVVGAFKQRITTIERTLVDILGRPYLCGGWDEIGWAYANAAGIDEVCLPRVIDCLASCPSLYMRKGWILSGTVSDRFQLGSLVAGSVARLPSYTDARLGFCSLQARRICRA